MNAKPAARDTSEFDREFVEDTFGKPDEAARDELDRAKRKPGRPLRGAGAGAIFLIVELDSGESRFARE